MHAPLYQFGLFGDAAGLIAGFIIGLGFGFFLERAGFTSARKLAAEFYFRDMSVLKVMFTAIVTAMLGLFLLSASGLVDITQVSLKPTVLWADILGGLILGVGFIIGGYCPGTSVAASATGRIDGWWFVGGLFFGTWIFGELDGRIPAFAAFCTEDGRPRITLADVTHVPYGILVLAVAVMAVAAFAVAEWAEVKVGGRKLADQPLIGFPGPLLNSTRRLLGILVLGGVLAALIRSPYGGPNVTIRQGDLAALMLRHDGEVAPEDLADALIAGSSPYEIVDLRPKAEFAKGSLPGAVNLPLPLLPDHGFSPTDRILLVGEDATHATEAWLFLKARGMTAVYTLRGGMDGWSQDVLHPVVANPPTPEDAKRIARARAFGGTPLTGSGKTAVPLALPSTAAPVAPPPAPMAAPPPRHKKHEGC